MGGSAWPVAVSVALQERGARQRTRQVTAQQRRGRRRRRTHRDASLAPREAFLKELLLRLLALLPSKHAHPLLEEIDDRLDIHLHSSSRGCPSLRARLLVQRLRLGFCGAGAHSLALLHIRHTRTTSTQETLPTTHHDPKPH